MISKKLIGDQAQKPISSYQEGTGLEGNISLLPVTLAGSKMKLWRQRNTGSGNLQPRLAADKVAELKKDIGEPEGLSCIVWIATDRSPPIPSQRSCRWLGIEEHQEGFGEYIAFDWCRM